MSICWKKNEINGEANFDIDEEYKLRQLSLFGNPKLSKLDKFKTDLRNLVIKNEQVTNKEVLEFTLFRGFEPKQAAIVLREMKKSNQIEHFSHPKNH